MALLHLEFPNLRLEIAGAGPESDNLEKEIGHRRSLMAARSWSHIPKMGYLRSAFAN